MIPLLRPLVKHFRAPGANFCRCRWGSCVGEALYASRCLMRRQQWDRTQGSGARIGAGRLETVPYMCGGGLWPSLSVGTPVLRCPKCPARHGGHLGAVSLRVCQHGKCRTLYGCGMGDQLADSSWARASSWAVLVSSRAERIFTVFSAKVRSLLFSSMVFMIRAATGAQLPFSMKATVRF